jgi:hypothetical protein
MTEKDTIMLDAWGREFLKEVCGPVTEQGVWRIKTNQELKELYKP